MFHDTDFEIKLVDACGICIFGKTLETLEEEFNHMLKCHIIDDSINLKEYVKEVNSKTLEIVDGTDVQELQDANKNNEVESTALEIVKKTIEEQLQILNSVDVLSIKIKVR